jgi:GTP cyclohydrolase FolE2
MNAPERIPFDVQSLRDERGVRIDAAGIKGLRYPVSIGTAGGPQPTVATFAMTVSLAAAERGTHMSRFVELLEGHTEPWDAPRLERATFAMLGRLGAAGGAIEMRFPLFLKKRAPVSGTQSLLDYEACWRASVDEDGDYTLWTTVAVPATSLCPCSKEISEYGAHNQRSSITLSVETADGLPFDELIGIAERSASCELYGLLKRPDEKYVTERAYDNPKFVEDLVRDVALALGRDPRVRRYRVEAENFESIHNHSAFAAIHG